MASVSAYRRALEIGGLPYRTECVLEGCVKPAALFNLCERHHSQADAGIVPRPPRRARAGFCGVEECHEAAVSGAFHCRAHLEWLRSMKGGRLLREAEKALDFPLRRIDPAKIRPSRFGMFRDLSDEAIESLYRSILHHKQGIPGLVRATGKGDYEIVYGWRRWTAVKRIPGRRFLAFVAPPSTPDEVLIWATHMENFERDLVGPWQRAVWLASMLERPDMTQRKLASVVGLSEQHLSRIMRVLRRSHEDVLKAFRAGQIGLSTAIGLLGFDVAEQPAVLADLQRRKLRGAKAAEFVRDRERASREEEFRRWLRDPSPYRIGPYRRGKGHEICFWGGRADLRRFYFRYVVRKRR